MLKIQEDILKLKKEKNAIIMAHYYQPIEIQEIADFVGDSFDLSVKAKNTQEDLIVFCGVDFMAETAKILSPNKVVLNPNPNATCPMSNMISAKEVKELRKKHPEAIVLCYVNTVAEVKAVSDVCVTSSTAVKIAKNVKEKDIIFIPDKNLASFVQAQTDKNIINVEGFCYVHNNFNKEDILKAQSIHNDAILLVHPECPNEVMDLADATLSTSGIIDYVRKSSDQKFLIGTEVGLVDRIKKMFPNKTFYSAGTPRMCVNMKKITLNHVFDALQNNKFEVNISKEVIENAQKSLNKMIDLSK